MGMLVNVYRAAGRDCTLGGISSNYDVLCVANVSGPFDPEEGTAVMLVEGNSPGTIKIVPASKNALGKWEPTAGWFMNGGNYAASCDSRFSRACEALLGHSFYGAVAIHDRQE